MKEYIFIDNSLFFPKEGILCIGDLHIGFDIMLREMGVSVPEIQFKSLVENLKKIFFKIKKYKLNKIIILGDIKHHFKHKQYEKNYFNELIEFLKKYVDDKNIILIKGNHD